MSLTAGILIDTLFGPRPAESLRPGDPILTAEAGVQLLDGVALARLGPMALARSRRMPILIRRGALARGAPARDTLVSPDQMILAPGEPPRRAAALIDGRRILPGRPRGAVTFVELHFDWPYTVTANGAGMSAHLLTEAAQAALIDPARPARLPAPDAPLFIRASRR